MHTIHSEDQRPWKRCLLDAIFELTPQCIRGVIAVDPGQN